MPVFVVPKEYYGGSGIASAIGQVADVIKDSKETKRRRQREDFLFDEAKTDSLRKQEEDIIKRTGQGSPEHKAWLEAHNLPTDNILVPIETRNNRELDRLLTIPEANRSVLDNATINVLQGRPVEGVKGMLDKYNLEMSNAELMNKVNQLTLQEAQLTADQRRKAREILATKYNTSPEAIDALMQITAVNQAQATYKSTLANTAETQARTDLYGAQAEEARTKAANGGFDMPTMRAMVTEYNKNRVTFGGRPFTIEVMQKGLARTLSPEDQKVFDRATTQYNLIPVAQDAKKQIAANDKAIAGLKARRITLAANKKTKKEVLTDLDAQIAELQAQNRIISRDFTSTREEAYGVPQGTVVAQMRGARGEATTASSEDFDAARYVATAIAKMGREEAKAAVMAMPDSDPNKAKMLAAFSPADTTSGRNVSLPARAAASNPEATANRTEPQRNGSVGWNMPNVSRAPVTGSVNISSFFDQVKRGAVTGRSMNSRIDELHKNIGNDLVALVMDTATSSPEAIKQPEIKKLVEQINNTDARIRSSVPSRTSAPSIDRQLFEFRLNLGKQLAEKLQSSGLVVGTIQDRIDELHSRLGEDLAARIR